MLVSTSKENVENISSPSERPKTKNYSGITLLAGAVARQRGRRRGKHLMFFRESCGFLQVLDVSFLQSCRFRRQENQRRFWCNVAFKQQGAAPSHQSSFLTPCSLRFLFRPGRVPHPRLAAPPAGGGTDPVQEHDGGLHGSVPAVQAGEHPAGTPAGVAHHAAQRYQARVLPRSSKIRTREELKLVLSLFVCSSRCSFL